MNGTRNHNIYVEVHGKRSRLWLFSTSECAKSIRISYILPKIEKLAQNMNIISIYSYECWSPNIFVDNKWWKKYNIFSSTEMLTSTMKKVRFNKATYIVCTMNVCIWDARHRHSCMKKTVLEVEQVKATTGNQNSEEQICMTEPAMTLCHIRRTLTQLYDSVNFFILVFLPRFVIFPTSL